MKVITWNVNSIRPRMARLLALLERHQPDLLCLQETKVEDHLFPADEIEALGYQVVAHGQKTYNGVSLLSREPLDDVRKGFPGDPIPEQARAISGSLGGLRVINLYVVNGQAMDSPKFEIKLRWLDALGAWLESEHDPRHDVLLVGDFNIAPDARDVHDPGKWEGKIHASEPERERLRRMLDWGTRDLQRERSDDAGLFTWWDYRFGAFHRGWGLRIDLALGTSSVAERLVDVSIDRDERKKSTGEGAPSDHAPVIVTLDS